MGFAVSLKCFCHPNHIITGTAAAILTGASHNGLAGLGWRIHSCSHIHASRRAVANSADQVNFSICVCANIKIAQRVRKSGGGGCEEGTKNSIHGLELGKLAVRWTISDSP